MPGKAGWSPSGPPFMAPAATWSPFVLYLVGEVRECRGGIEKERAQWEQKTVFQTSQGRSAELIRLSLRIAHYLIKE